MADPFDSQIDEPKPNSLIPIGLAILAVFIVPTFLYSIGPQGPIKKDHVVFSTGHHRAYLAEKTQFHILGYQGLCVLEVREPLLVLESAAAREDGTYLA